MFLRFSGWGLARLGSAVLPFTLPPRFGPIITPARDRAALSGLSAVIASERSTTVSAEKAGSIVGLSRLPEKTGCTYLFSGHRDFLGFSLDGSTPPCPNRCFLGPKYTWGIYYRIYFSEYCFTLMIGDLLPNLLFRILFYINDKGFITESTFQNIVLH